MCFALYIHKENHVLCNFGKKCLEPFLVQNDEFKGKKSADVLKNYNSILRPLFPTKNYLKNLCFLVIKGGGVNVQFGPANRRIFSVKF
jgi:hypothetical protein